MVHVRYRNYTAFWNVLLYMFFFFQIGRVFLNTHDSQYYLTLLAILTLLTIATYLLPKP